MEKKIVISFVTKNEHKYIEAKDALAPYPNIVLEQLAEHKQEYKDDSLLDPIKTIATKAAEEASRLYNKIVVAEDAGIFFDAYDGFPGLNTKWVIKHIGYDGILRLLVGVNRAACFRSVIALCKPNGIPDVFEGVIRGHIANKVYGEDVNCMDYDRIFIPDGAEIPFSLMMENKKLISHRKIAFQKLGESLSKGTKYARFYELF